MCICHRTKTKMKSGGSTILGEMKHMDSVCCFCMYKIEMKIYAFPEDEMRKKIQRERLVAFFLREKKDCLLCVLSATYFLACRGLLELGWASLVGAVGFWNKVRTWHVDVGAVGFQHEHHRYFR